MFCVASCSPVPNQNISYQFLSPSPSISFVLSASPPVSRVTHQHKLFKTIFTELAAMILMLINSIYLFVSKTSTCYIIGFPIKLETILTEDSLLVHINSQFPTELQLVIRPVLSSSSQTEINQKLPADN